MTELNIRSKTVKVDWHIPIDFCHTKGTIAHGGTVSFILDASMFFVVDLIHKGYTTGLTLGLNIQYLNPCRPGRVTTEASILREGKKFCVHPVPVDPKQYNRLFRDSINVSLS